ncbi:MAG TPA: TolC family protein [Pyrinomonadaceae bacterium]|nr:TolC family protein [Pyrinomonadaceae bacterium]
MVNRIRIALSACLIIIAIASPSASAQRKSKTKPAAKPANELTKLREEFVKATNETKAGLARLIVIYEADVAKAEEKLAASKKLYDDGLIAKARVDDNERALAEAREKVTNTRKQINEADAQVAAILVESEAEKTIARNLRLARQSLVRTTAFIRYSGAGSGWSIGDAWKIQRFFSDTFKRELPVAVFGQGAIHDRWRLDHRNAMDISLHPDSAEGQALLGFLQKNGIPYLAFRSAIPGTATGPHIHIGRPSHRY